MEDLTETIHGGEVFVASTFPKDEDGNPIPSDPTTLREYNRPTVLGALDEASGIKPFPYKISEKFVPSIYISEIDGHAEAGASGWNFRIDGILPGSLDAGQARLDASFDEVVWFYGDGSEEILRIEVDKTIVDVGASFTVTVNYYDSQGISYRADSSMGISIEADVQYSLNDSGQVAISIDAAGEYEVYAEGSSYVRSNRKFVTVEDSTPPLDTFHHFPLNPDDPELLDALEFFSEIQNSDGSIGGFDTSCWVSMAIAAAGQDPNKWEKNGNSIVDYLINNRNNLDEDKVTDIAKFILAMTAADVNPRNIGRIDYVSMLESKTNNNQFGDESMYNDDFWAVLALISANVQPESTHIQNSVEFIKNHQNSDGGWSWHSGESDTDNTAAALMALMAAGENTNSPPISNAVTYLKDQLASNGGFIFMGETNSASDSWGIMALVATNIDPTESDWIRNNVSPIDHLLSLQNADGSFSLKDGEAGDPWWTAYVIPALLGKPYPIAIKTIENIYVRIEDESSTIWKNWVEIPGSVTIEAYNSGQKYNTTGNNALAALDRASIMGGFVYQVSDQWYPDTGFYVNSIAGHDASGEYGWMYRVNYSLPDISMDNYQIKDGDEILIYWGTQGIAPLKVEVDPGEVAVGEPFTVTVTYLNDSTHEWLALENATVHVNPDYLTDSEGKTTITLSDPKVYNITVEKWGDTPEDQFIKSDVAQAGVGIPIPEFSSSLPIVWSITFLTLYILFRKKPSQGYQ